MTKREHVPWRTASLGIAAPFVQRSSVGHGMPSCDMVGGATFNYPWLPWYHMTHDAWWWNYVNHLQILLSHNIIPMSCWKKGSQVVSGPSAHFSRSQVINWVMISHDIIMYHHVSSCIMIIAGFVMFWCPTFSREWKGHLAKWARFSARNKKGNDISGSREVIY
jgi:hypothetical protein